MIMGREFFETADLYLAAAVACFASIDPNFSNRNGRVIFLFPKSDVIYRAIADYNSDEPLPVFQYAGTIKDLKGRMFRLKSEGIRNEF
jgi:hypothetical protein